MASRKIATKTSKTKLEAKFEQQQQHKEKKVILIKTVKPKITDENANTKVLEQVAFSKYSCSMLIPSMVSHFTPKILSTFQRSASTISMIAHYALLSPPGSSLVSMVEVKEALEEVFERMLKNIKWCTSSIPIVVFI